MGGGPRWTEEDIKYLESCWGRVQMPTIARNLKRTVRAVKDKAIKLNLGGYTTDCGQITLSSLLLLLGYKRINPNVIGGLTKRGFPFKKIRVNKRAFYMVAIPKFWEWAEMHRDYFEYYKLEPLILGKEPEWVAEQRHIDYRCKYPRRKWKSADDKLLEYLINKGQTCQDISKRLNRSENAVQSRCTLLGLHYPKPRKYVSWSAAETKELLSLASVHYPIKYIAEKIGRSEISIKGRLEYLARKEATNGGFTTPD